MNSSRWQILSFDPQAVQQLHESLQLAPQYCQLLTQRGIHTPAAATAFFQPRLEDLHSPFLMADMHLAVQRMELAIQRGERLLLYGDYDVDGTTSVALMFAFLHSFYQHIDYYLPDRDKEGYGVSLAGVEYARATGATLVIAMDCGIKAHEAVLLATSYGIDFIICDHHVPEGGLPAAVANLDPKRSDCPYPYKDLSGCGIAFKLAQAFSLHQNMPAEELSDLLDLVAVSIACDIVPITGENRILAHFGLHRLNHMPRVGLWALSSRINRRFPLDVTDLVFGMGPLINAAGRLGDAREAVRMLLATDRNSALDAASALVSRNKERREVDFATATEARRRFTELPDFATRRSIVLFDPEWHKGIIGIVASRVTEDFNRPSVILTQSNDRAVGSARSIRGFDLYAALQQCEDLFFSFGGHAFAAGMQMPVENVAAFAERFERIVQESMTQEEAMPIIDIAAKIRLEEITAAFWQQLRRFEPFGPHNRSPVFWAEAVEDTGRSRILDNNHVRLSLRHPGSRTIVSGIAFGLADTFERLKKHPFDIAFNIREEDWHGQPVLTIQVKDMKPLVD